MKNFIAGNKEAWEEAYGKAPLSYKEIAPRIRQEKDAYLDRTILDTIAGIAIEGKVIAQFCCNNGREVLSIAYHRHAAAVYGFDIAENMAADAEKSRIALGLPGAFVQTDVEKMPERFYGMFDVIFMFIGAICWFDERETLFGEIARCLKPGGRYVLVDAHPFTNMLLAEGEPGFDPEHREKIGYSYWKSAPFVENGGMSYMVKEDYVGKVFTSYPFRISELIGGLLKKGFSLEDFREYPSDVIGIFEKLSDQGIPLSFSLVAKRIK